ncbi:MAG: PD40 domain-containing protein [Armatimonadetes bacterium]|nr:PD40 domain-containing protein [Armatimonadota bacterium]MDE2205950.1 PD40 domain-containing protein [Armatimonadota bacterium]
MKLKATIRIAALSALFVPALCAARFAAQAEAAPPAPVSFYRQIFPILREHCQMCHQPRFQAASGKLVVTTYALFTKGGAHGATVKPGDPAHSLVLDYLTGKTMLMPKGGPPLMPAQIDMFRRWIAEGAHNDTPAVHATYDAAHPPIYSQPPVIVAMAWSPDGKTLAVSGYHEVVLHSLPDFRVTARLIGDAQQVESISYSPDGSLIAVAGGTPARMGEVQFWSVATHKLVRAVPAGFDTVFGGAFSPDSKQFSYGSSNNSVHVITVPDGKPVMRLDSHSDWVFSTAFSDNGRHVLSASRDEAIKLTLVSTGQFIDDINTHTTPLRCLARFPRPLATLSGISPQHFLLVLDRNVLPDVAPTGTAWLHLNGAGINAAGDFSVQLPTGSIPTQPSVAVTLPGGAKDGVYDVNITAARAPLPDTDTTSVRLDIGKLTVSGAGARFRLQPDQVVCGGSDGIPRLYKVFRTEPRTMNMEDHNMLREFPRQLSAITSVGISPDDGILAVGSENPVINLYNMVTGKLITTMHATAGATYALAFSPDGRLLAAGGFDGSVRLFQVPGGALRKSFSPVPLSKPLAEKRQSKAGLSKRNS